MYRFLVTCGRGLEKFVVEEIQQKVSTASNILRINEGKITFDIDLGLEVNLDGDCGKHKFHGIFQLKMVERIFLLLYFEAYEEHPTAFDVRDENILENIFASINWRETTAKVQFLLSLSPYFPSSPCICSLGGTPEHVPCGDAEVSLSTETLIPYIKKRKNDPLGNCAPKLAVESAEQSSYNKRRVHESHGTGELPCSSTQQLPSSNSTNDIALEHFSKSGLRNSIASSIEFRASCRITGKWKMPMNRKTRDGVSEAKYNSYGNKPPAEKRSGVLVHSSSPCINPIGKGQENCMRAAGSGVGQLEECEDTGKQKADAGLEVPQCIAIPASSSSPSSENGWTTANGNNLHSSGKILKRKENFVDRIGEAWTGNFKTDLVSRLVIAVQEHTQGWSLNWSRPNVDVYLNLTDLHALLGVALCRTPVSLRPYIPHIGLRSTLCCLMVHLAIATAAEFQERQLAQSNKTNTCKTMLRAEHVANKDTFKLQTHLGMNHKKIFTLLDPMCGSGTILAEAVHSFNISYVIGCDVSASQLDLAACNLHLSPGHSYVSLMRADAAAMPLPDNCVDAIVCDLPFGRQHRPYLARCGQGHLHHWRLREEVAVCNRDNTSEQAPTNPALGCDELLELLTQVLRECARLLVEGGAAVLLLPSSKEAALQRICSGFLPTDQDSSLQLLNCHHVAMGTTSGIVCVLQKT